MSHQTQIWTNGRKGSIACITAIVYENGAIVASSEAEQLTEHQMHKALGQEFPGVEFSVSQGRGSDDMIFMEGVQLNFTVLDEPDAGNPDLTCILATACGATVTDQGEQV